MILFDNFAYRAGSELTLAATTARSDEKAAQLQAHGLRPSLPNGPQPDGMVNIL
jgi:hypothetical protein